MHLPSSMEEQEEARRRLAFEELFLLQLTLLLRRELSRSAVLLPSVVSGTTCVRPTGMILG